MNQKMASLMYYLPVFATVTCIKFLLIPTYISPDFEVHRNWLAITHKLAFPNWYIETTSKWTLDYPPLFAWFEWLLSQFAVFFDPQMLGISNLNYVSHQTVFFQRLTVIITDLVFVYAVVQFCQLVVDIRTNDKKTWMNRGTILAMLLLWNPGLLIVDQIHFQYSGFLNGLLLLSMVRMVQSRLIEGTIWFAVLLNMNQIYLYVAPAYFVFLFRNYCFTRSKHNGQPEFRSFHLLNLIKLGSAVITIFAVSFGPFILMGQLNQVLARLFPFKRGLSHAYWAPNFWALYNTLDKSLNLVGSKLPFLNMTRSGMGAMTGGLVEEYPHSFLPNVNPTMSFVLTALSMLPILWNLWKTPRDPWIFIRTVAMCAFCSFLFGWHVHQKAILIVILPLTLLAVLRLGEAKNFLFLSTVAHFSLFPLLPQPAETPIKIMLLLLHAVYAFNSLTKLHTNFRGPEPRLFSTPESFYLIGLIYIQIYHSFGYILLGVQHYQFLPLILISNYCAAGIVYSWLKLYMLFITG